jgi:hypothetical protein
MLMSPLVQDKFSLTASDPQATLFQRLHDYLQNGFDPDSKNLDDFIIEAAARFPQDNFVRIFRYYVENFKVYYVLNKFNSVAESVENTIKPFVENIFRTVSGKVSFHNLGWVVENDEIKKSGETGTPYLLRRHYQKMQAPSKAVDFDASLRAMCGLETKKRLPEQKRTLASELSSQIDLLRMIYICNAGKDPETNLNFIASRIGEFSANSNHQFGMKRIYSELEFLERFRQNCLKA